MREMWLQVMLVDSNQAQLDNALGFMGDQHPLRLHNIITHCNRLTNSASASAMSLAAFGVSLG